MKRVFVARLVSLDCRAHPSCLQSVELKERLEIMVSVLMLPCCRRCGRRWLLMTCTCSFHTVNEYGIIHQTITLRDADENMLAYSGGPETKDRWVILLLLASSAIAQHETGSLTNMSLFSIVGFRDTLGPLHIADSVILISVGSFISCEDQQVQPRIDPSSFTVGVHPPSPFVPLN